MRPFIIGALGTTFFSFTASASEIGTYRAGNSYMSTPALSPDQCISQCQGDARCKGWNFVTVGQHSTICEFNSLKATPIASSVSISGDSQSGRNNYRLVQGGQRTTRIGHVPAAVTYSSPGLVTRTGHVPTNYRTKTVPTRSTSTPIVTKPGWQQQRLTHQRRPVSSQNQRHTQLQSAATFRPHLDTARQPRPQQNNARPEPVTPRPVSERHRFVPLLDNTPQQQPVVSQRQTAQIQVPDQPVVRPEETRNIPSLSQMPGIQPRASIESGLAGGPVAATLPRSSSLYGSLYDDVKAPRALGAGDIPVDPDAPISTVKSVPVKN